MPRQFIRRYALIILVLSLLAGCGRVQEPVGGESQPFTSPLVSPLAAGGDMPIPQPGEGMGTVTGILLNSMFENRPYADRNIFVAELFELERTDGGDEPMFMAALDVKTDPNGWTDGSGRFVIPDLEPGTYALAVLLPSMHELLLESADTGGNISFEVVAGEITDLGVLTIRSDM